MPPQARLGDKALIPADAHGCVSCPHTASGPAVAGSPNVNVNGRPAIRVDDPGIHTACCGGNTWNAQTGSKSVFINGKPAHRLGDVVRHCGGVGKCIEGSGNVFVGDWSIGRTQTNEDTASGNWISFGVIDNSCQIIPYQLILTSALEDDPTTMDSEFAGVIDLTLDAETKDMSVGLKHQIISTTQTLNIAK